MRESEEIFERMERDRVYYQAHIAELVRQYPDRWIAIYDGQFVGADADLDRLLADMRAREIPPEESMVEYLSTEKDILLLPG